MAVMRFDDAFELEIRDPNCTACKLHRQAEEVCEGGHGPADADIVVVTRMGNSDRYQANLEAELTEAGLDVSRMYFTGAIKCRNFEQNASNLDVKTCRQYLDKEIAAIKPKWILAFGNEALMAVSGHSGITKYRGRPIDKVIAGHETTVFSTVSPSAVARNPGQRPGFVADLRLFASAIQGLEPPKLPKYKTIETKADVAWLVKCLDKTELISYDIETRGKGEADPMFCIVSLSATCVLKSGKTVCWALPLSHPGSVWRRQWRALLRFLAPYLTKPKKQVAHNGKFDAKWLRVFGVPMRVTFDTMLAAHLLDENRLKGLKPQAASRLGIEPWGIDTSDLWIYPIDQVLTYNVLDTYYTYGIYLPLREELMAQPRLIRIFSLILMPAEEELIETEKLGIWADRQRLAERGKIARDMRDEVDRKLMEWVPDLQEMGAIQGFDPIAEVDWPVDAKGRPREVNFNVSIFARWLIFEHLGLPVVKRGKEKPDGTAGDPSMAEDVMLELKENPGHPVIDLMLERSRWQKMVSAFFEAYDEILDPNDRVHSSFKLFGTVTGRLSSGREEQDKITARRDRGRGINLQQVPRDTFVRGLFGAAPGYYFVEVDFSQAELRIVGYIARERTIIRLYQLDEDIHSATATWVLGKPRSQVTKDDRKKAKAVNFGFIYGMGAAKFVTTAFNNYQVRFTRGEAQEIRREYYRRFPGLTAWHNRQRRLVHMNGRVTSPIGRVRNLPDIRSADQKVVAEAERQAINSPVQSFASDLNTLGMILVSREFRRLGIDGHSVGLVHDATLWEIRLKDLKQALPLIKYTYENLPLQRYFGVVMDVPIKADIKVGTHWGDAVELTEEQVYRWKPSLLGTVLERAH